MVQPGPRSYPPVIVRSKMVLEMTSELITQKDWPHEQARISLRPQGPGPWNVTIFGSDSADSIPEVVSGAVQLAIVNPGAVLALARNGTGPFKEKAPIRAITIIGSFDQLGLGVAERTGITSLEDLRDKKYPLKISVRGQRDHTVHLVLEEVFKAHGFTSDDLRSWGGDLIYHDGLPHPTRTKAVADGEADALFDEAAGMFVNRGPETGMRMLGIADEPLRKLEAVGFRRGVLQKSLYNNLPHDIQTIDYSGFILYVREDARDDMVRAFCAAIEARKNVIPRDQGVGPLPLDRMCQDTPEGPMYIPLHPAAAAYWKEQGYL